MRLSDIKFQEELFYAKILRSEDGCWEWQGRSKNPGKKRKGGGLRGVYGQFGVTYPNRPQGKRKGVMDAHRLMWIISNGEVNDKLMVCHHCDNPLCVRPDHLYMASQSQNMIDCVERKRHAMIKKTHCKWGHEYTPENTSIYITKDNHRERSCKTCHKERERRRRERMK